MNYTMRTTRRPARNPAAQAGPKNRVVPEIEQAIVELAISEPAGGPTAKVQRTEQTSTLDLGRRGAWRQRHDLETMNQRQKAPDTKRARGTGLNESQLVSLEKAKANNAAHGEFETDTPGNCVAQDTFYLGTLGALARYQQSFLDTYSKVAFNKLHNRQPLHAADLFK
jgi:hypothetical protein